MTQKITTQQVREKYLKHFEKFGHAIIPSSRLVPENDPTTLFTGSGMQPMVPYLLGQKHPLGTRIADSQKCFRSGDIEEVGDNRHTTFFEMLGNWSLGDYFKEEQISWMWEFIISEIKVDPKNLYVSCFEGAEKEGIPRDTFSAELWQKLFKQVGIDAKINETPEKVGMLSDEKIFYYSAKKNWWSRGGSIDKTPVGDPCGPDSEMFYDFDPVLENGQQVNNFHAKSYFKNDKCHPNCDCGRFMEIGNNVFMEYIRKSETVYEKLSAPNVDHGSGLERFVAAANNDNDVFNLDVFDTAKLKIQELSGVKYNPILDDKEILGVDKLTQSYRVILDHLRGATFFIADGVYPSNKDQGYFIRRLLRRAVRNGRNLGIKENFCAKIADIYIQHHGDLYTELKENREKVMQVIDDEETKFNKTLLNGEKEFFNILNELRGIKKVSGSGGINRTYTPTPETFSQPLSLSGMLAFTLYESYGFPLEIIEDLCKENNLSFDKLGFEEARTKHSELSRAGAEQKFKGGLADNSEMVVKYHTATHLLHQALKNVLGEDVSQRGSNITGERLRFDFSYDKKMIPEEVKQTEDQVNEWIQKDLKVRREEINKTEAEERRPIHLFGEKYGEVVSIYTIAKDDSGKVRGLDAVSVEFCGGPHVEHTGQIGEGEKVFKIIKEEAVSAGVRRIKATLQ